MRLLSFIALAAMLTAAAPAYSIEHHEFSLGVGTNFNMPDTEGDAGENIDEELSVTLAIAAKEVLKINDQWFLRTGLWLQEKSAKYSWEVAPFEGDITASTIYASIPLNVQYKFTDLISVFGGYIADVRINDYCTADGDLSGSGCTLDDDSKSVVHVANLGMSFNFSSLLTLDVNYQHGVSDVYKDEVKIHTLQAMLFFKF